MLPYEILSDFGMHFGSTSTSYGVLASGACMLQRALCIIAITKAMRTLAMRPCPYEVLPFGLC